MAFGGSSGSKERLRDAAIHSSNFFQQFYLVPLFLLISFYFFHLFLLVGD